MNREFNQLNKPHDRDHCLAFFMAGQPEDGGLLAHRPEALDDPENEKTDAMTFRGAVGFVTNRARMRITILKRNEKAFLDEQRRDEERWRKLTEEMMRGRIFSFTTIDSELASDPELNLN